MYDTVKHCLKLGLSDARTTDYLVWILQHPGQIVLTVSQVISTRDINQTFDLPAGDIDGALIRIRDQMINTIKNVCSLVLGQVESTKLLTVEAMVTLQVHWRDIVETLIRNHVSQPGMTCALHALIVHQVREKNDFEWQKHLRYEWNDKDSNFQIQQADASFPYGYEYLGCSSRLVVTPLTDRLA